MDSSFKSLALSVFQKGNTRACWVYRIFLIIQVLIVCTNYVIETYPISQTLRQKLEMVDFIISLLFFVDYCMRFWAHSYSIRYLFTPLAIVDFIAILPLFLSANFQFIRILRVLRILRLFHLLQRDKSKGWNLFEFRLRLGTIFFTLFCIIFISSGIFFYAENSVNPQINTFLDSLYFTIVSLTTVGYGDIIPYSPTGRLITILMISTGFTLIPWQLTDLGRYLIRSSKKESRKCSSCQQQWHDHYAFYCCQCGAKLPQIM